MRKLLIILLLFVPFLIKGQTTYYVATTGSDSNPGTISQPWLSWQKAITTAHTPGDTVFFRGGVYNSLICERSDGGLNGTALNPIVFINYPGEVPILDGSSKTSRLTGLQVSYGSYFKFIGLVVRNHPQIDASNSLAGIAIQWCNNVTIERCVAHHIGVRGFYIYDSNNITTINCDAYYCRDTLTTGQHGDGFIVMDDHTADDINKTITYIGCRSWMNMDDGWDAHTEGLIEWDNCWTFLNAKNGFKIGLSMRIQKDDLARKMTNCIMVYNNSGLTTNDASAVSVKAMNIYNNTSVLNNYNGFVIFNTSDTDPREAMRIFRNNIAYANGTTPVAAYGTYTHDHNSWDAVPSVTVTNDDFISVDSTGITSARQTDGSFPDNNCYNDFLKLVSSSDLVDVGVDVGLSYTGILPDLGAFEYSSGEKILTKPGYIIFKNNKIVTHIER